MGTVYDRQGLDDFFHGQQEVQPHYTGGGLLSEHRRRHIDDENLVVDSGPCGVRLPWSIG